MKSIVSLTLVSLFLAIPLCVNAQLLEKLIKQAVEKDVAAYTTQDVEKGKKRSEQLFKELMGEMAPEPQNFESKENRTFEGWSYGRGDIFLATVDGQSIHSGYMFDDGKFLAMFPDEKVNPHIPVTYLIGKKCQNREKALISDNKAKLTMGLLYVVKDSRYLGGLVRASSMTKAINALNQNERGMESDKGDYHYFYIHSTKTTTVKCDCQWTRNVTEEGLSVLDRLDYTLEKGWNLIKVSILNTHQTENGSFFTERSFETVPTEKKETPWYFIYKKITEVYESQSF